ncbi:diguanylate cyclase [Lysobacter korlensis]|uniref:diguanylate cyclase n=1 Tax=Lysobacter korlensis TaxID=553636 RepID=A0ABV6RIL1_9GAMM
MPSDSNVQALDGREPARLAALARYAILDTPPEQAFDDIARLAMMVCGTQAAAVALVDRDRAWFKAAIGVDARELPRSQAISERILRTRATVVISEMLADPRGAASPLHIGERPVRSFAGAPLLTADDHVLGAVCVADDAPRTLSALQREGLEVLARQAMQLLELRRYAMDQRRQLDERDATAQRVERAHAELEAQHARLLDTARRDQLTGLLNRNALAQLLQDPDQVQRLQSSGYCLILIDVDHFKQVNDRHGHLLGDRALRAVADVVSASVRETDVAVRYGGEEFLVALPRTDLAHATEIAHRIRERVEATALPFVLTVSIGVAPGDPELDRPEQVFDRADQALYRAKASGRNRVVVDDTLRV